MHIDELLNELPAAAKDLRLNLRSLLAEGTALSPTQLWGSALASALATGHVRLIQAVAREARAHLDEPAFDGARTAAALMAMNNVYYRALHLVQNQEYARLPARLRMQGLAQHGTDPLDFELWCLAVSAVNGCGRCLEAHEGTLRKKDVEAPVVQNALRVAAVMHGVARTLGAEAALAESAVG